MFAAFLMEIGSVRLKKNSTYGEALEAFRGTPAAELPVVGDEGVLMGTVRRAFLEASPDETVEGLIRKDFASVGPEATLSEVSRLLGARDSVFVLDHGGRLLGVITRGSLSGWSDD